MSYDNQENGEWIKNEEWKNSVESMNTPATVASQIDEEPEEVNLSIFRFPIYLTLRKLHQLSPSFSKPERTPHNGNLIPSQHLTHLFHAPSSAQDEILQQKSINLMLKTKLMASVSEAALAPTTAS